MVQSEDLYLRQYGGVTHCMNMNRVLTTQGDIWASSVAPHNAATGLILTFYVSQGVAYFRVLDTASVSIIDR